MCLLLIGRLQWITEYGSFSLIAHWHHSVNVNAQFHEHKVWINRRRFVCLCYVELRLEFQTAKRRRRRKHKIHWTSTNGELRRICIHQSKNADVCCCCWLSWSLCSVIPSMIRFCVRVKIIHSLWLNTLAASRYSILLLLLARNRLFIIVYCVVISLVMCWFRGESSSPIMLCCYTLSL